MEEHNFETILKELRNPLKAMVKKLNGHHQELDDEDLFQEASLHLWNRFSKNELFDKNKSYILKSCYFHLKNYLRNKSLSRKLTSIDEPIDENGTLLKDMLTEGDDSESLSLEKAMFLDNIKKCCLTNREKDCLYLFLEDLTTREIASRLKISHVRVVKLMAKVKEKYKNRISSYQDE